MASAAAGEAAGRRANPARPLVFGALILAGIVLLTALGIWQLQRRVWKLDLIHRVDQRIEGAPVAAPGPPDWPGMTTADDAYRRVRMTVHFTGGRGTLVQAVTRHGGGYWVLEPFRTDDGFTVLVNRGFAPPEAAQAFTQGGTAGAPTRLTGLLRMSEPGGAFLRHNDAAADRWYSRDVAAIAAARGIDGVAPYFVDADASGDGPPIGGLTVVAFPNNHLLYAITWFGLAAMLAGWTVHLVRQERLSREKRRPPRRAAP